MLFTEALTATVRHLPAFYFLPDGSNASSWDLEIHHFGNSIIETVPSFNKKKHKTNLITKRRQRTKASSEFFLERIIVIFPGVS